MILKKAIFYATGVAALAAAASVAVVALAFALHAALAPQIGEAWASAAVAGAAALLGVIVAAIMFARVDTPRRDRQGVRGDDRDLTSRLFELARDKPWVAAGAVAAAAAIVLKNPKITAAILSAVMAGRASKK